MIETLVAFWMIWRFELICGALLIIFPFIRNHFKKNIIVAEYINQATNQIAAALEARPEDPETGLKPNMKRSAQKARRREVRKKLAKEARKANRGNQ